MSMQAGPGSAGWFDDPTHRFDRRYWDGTQWTSAVMQGEIVETDRDALPAEVAEAARAQAPRPEVPTPAAEPAPSPNDRITSLPPRETQERLAFQLTAMGFAPGYVAPGRLDAAIATKSEPNGLLLVILLLLCLWPGILYWILASKTTTHAVTLTFHPAGGGTRVAVQGTPGAVRMVYPALAQLPW